MSKETMLFSLAGIVLALEGLMFFYHFRIRKFSRKLLSQILFGNTFFSVFYLCAAFSKATIYVSPNWKNAWGIVTVLPWFGLAFLRWNVRSRKVFHISIWLKRHKWSISLILLTLLTRFGLLDTLQKWDSSEYYFTVMKIGERFDFSPGSFLTAFRLLSHPSYGFAMWASLGEYIAPQNVSGVLTISLLLTCAANNCIYHLLRRHWTKLPDWQAFLGAVMCSMVPLYWCGMTCTMADYYLALFVIFMIYSDHKKDHLMVLFWGGMAAFCKEVGMILVAFYFAAKVICSFFSGRVSLAQRFKQVFLNRSIYAGICIGAAIIVYFILSRSLISWSHSAHYSNPMTWSGSGDLLYNTFGIQADNIITRLTEYFVANFTWLLTLCLLAALIAKLIRSMTRLIRRTAAQAEFNIPAIIESLFVLAAYGAFMCLYITAGSIRYNVVFTLLYSVLAYAIIAKIFRGKLIAVTGCILSVLFAVQSFCSIDFVTNRLFRTVDVGNTSLLCISQQSHKNPGGDYYITNLQYPTLHKNFSKMFAAIDLQPEDTILIAGHTYAETAKNASLTEFRGRHSDIRWDPEEKQLKNSISEEHFMINTLNTNQLWGLKQIPFAVRENMTSLVSSVLAPLEGRLFVYFSPLYQSEDSLAHAALLAQLERVFTLGEMQSVETAGNILTFCELTVKPEEEWTLPPYDYLDSGTPSEIALQRFYRAFRTKAVEFDGSRTVVQPGDQITVTIVCYDEEGNFLNMETSPKGTILNTIVVGTGYNLYGVDDSLIGREIGETATVHCTIPENYRYYPLLEGRTVTMDITIHGIISMLPEITDQLVVEHLGYANAIAYLDSICDRLGVSSRSLRSQIAPN